jgi:MFS family permease
VRGAGGLLLDPLFGGLFLGRLLSSAGVWVHSIVAAIVVFDATGSALLVGTVSVVQFAPQVFLSPWAGARADQGDAARQILVGRLMCGAGSGGLALWIALVPDPGDGAVTIAVLTGSLLVGFGFVVGGPAQQSIIPSLIRPGELTTAMALSSIPMTTARIVGPALGAYVAAHLGDASGFAVAAATHMVFVALLAGIRFPRGSTTRPGVDYSVRAALRHVRHDRPLLLLLVSITAVGFATEPSTTLAPALSAELGGGTAMVGALSAAFGIGAAVGLLLIWLVTRRAGSALVASVGMWAMVAGLALAASGTWTWVVMLGFGLTGIGFSMAMTGVTTLVQERVPAELRGRVMALWLVGFVGSRPLAAAVVGGAADLVSVPAALLVTAALVSGVALICRPRALSAL